MQVKITFSKKVIIIQLIKKDYTTACSTLQPLWIIVMDPTSITLPITYSEFIYLFFIQKLYTN